MSSTGGRASLDVWSDVAGDASLWQWDEVAEDDDGQLRGSELSRLGLDLTADDRRLSDAFFMWDSERDYRQMYQRHTVTLSFGLCDNDTTWHYGHEPDTSVVLTLWRPLLPYGYSYKTSCDTPGEAVICNFCHPSTLTFSPGHKSARMSKFTTDGLTWSGTGCFIAVPAHMATVAIIWLKPLTLLARVRMAYGNNGHQKVKSDEQVFKFNTTIKK